jgi:hypothetical protein
VDRADRNSGADRHLVGPPAGELVPRLASLLLPAAIALILAATLSPTAHRIAAVGSCGTHLTTTGGLTSLQGLLNVLLFIPAAGLLTLASGRPADGIAAGIGLSAAVEAVQALVPPAMVEVRPVARAR